MDSVAVKDKKDIKLLVEELEMIFSILRAELAVSVSIVSRFAKKNKQREHSTNSVNEA